MNKQVWLGAMLLAALLPGCGGGGGGAPMGTESLAALSGVYGGGPFATVIIDNEGRIAAALGAVDVQQTTTVNAALTGNLTADGFNWSSDNAVFAQSVTRTGFPIAQDTLVPATVSGNFAIGEAVAFGITAAGVSSLFPARFEVPWRNEASYPGASIAQVAGRYRLNFTGADLNIAADGSVSGTVRAGCQAGGQVRVTHPGRNVYSFALALTGSGCAQAMGRTYEFLAFLSASPSPAALVMVGRIEGEPFYASMVRQAS